MVKVKDVNHFLEYTKCTAEELRGFIKARTGKVTTAHNITYLAGKLRALNKNVTFRFLDLPTEMRLGVYAELLHRPDPYDAKRIYAQILRCSKEIHREAEPELNGKANMLIRITPIHPTRGTMCSVGCQTRKLTIVDELAAQQQSWSLYDDLTPSVAGVQCITLDIELFHKRTHMLITEADRHRIVQYLFALTAALRTSKLRKLTVRVGPDGVDRLADLLWPIHRIKSTIEFSMEGVPRNIQDNIFANQLEQDTQPDSIFKGKQLMTRIDGLAVLFSHPKNARLLLKLDALRAQVVKAAKWSEYKWNDNRSLRSLGKVEAALDMKNVKKAIRKAEEVNEAHKEGEE